MKFSNERVEEAFEAGARLVDSWEKSVQDDEDDSPTCDLIECTINEAMTASVIQSQPELLEAYERDPQSIKGASLVMSKETLAIIHYVAHFYLALGVGLAAMEEIK